MINAAGIAPQIAVPARSSPWGWNDLPLFFVPG